MRNNNLIKKKRIWYWDTVKFLMILFVVVGHVVGYIASYGREDVMAINLFLYTVHGNRLFVSGIPADSLSG